MFERLLVPVDFSDQSLQMFECVSRLSEGGEGEMVLLHVMPRGGQVTPEQNERVERMLASVQVRGIQARFIREEGNPVEVILRTARREGTTMIAMASSGKGKAREFLVGSTTLGVIRDSTLPVLIDKFQVMEDSGRIRVRASCTDFLRSAIVPLDFTSCNGPVLAALDDLVKRGLKQAVLFHVVDSSRYRVSDDSRFQRVKENLMDIAEGIEPRGCDITTHVHFGSPVYNIMEVAREFNSSLILMGTHGKSLLHEMTLGSVSEEVIRRAPVSLLIIPCAQ